MPRSVRELRRVAQKVKGRSSPYGPILPAAPPLDEPLLPLPELDASYFVPLSDSKEHALLELAFRGAIHKLDEFERIYGKLFGPAIGHQIHRTIRELRLFLTANREHRYGRDDPTRRPTRA
jgi:hypothetical protein